MKLSIIKTHDITLYGGTEKYNIVLRPLSDRHLPLLYKWNADPEVLYWTEGGEDIQRIYDENIVHIIYGGVSQNALCFLIEVNEKPIGECWLQKMNLPDVISMYPENVDVRRIDMAIGEKEYWGKGIGTAFIRMLTEFAFCSEHTDVLHCFSEDYNKRSNRVWLKNGYKFLKSDPLPQPQKGKLQNHYILTKQDFIEKHRVKIPQEQVFMLPVLSLQPTQLYISEGKLNLMNEWFKGGITNMDAIPVKLIKNRYMMTDGHTRAVCAYLNGIDKVPCAIDNDELELAAYLKDIDWCREEGIHTIADLSKKIVKPKYYEILWRKRCMEMII